MFASLPTKILIHNSLNLFSHKNLTSYLYILFSLVKEETPQFNVNYSHTRVFYFSFVHQTVKKLNQKVQSNRSSSPERF